MWCLGPGSFSCETNFLASLLAGAFIIPQSYTFAAKNTTAGVWTSECGKANFLTEFHVFEMFLSLNQLHIVPLPHLSLMGYNLSVPVIAKASEDPDPDIK